MFFWARLFEIVGNTLKVFKRHVAKYPVVLAGERVVHCPFTGDVFGSGYPD